MFSELAPLLEIMTMGLGLRIKTHFAVHTISKRCCTICNSQRLSQGEISKLRTSTLSIRSHQVSDGLACLFSSFRFSIFYQLPPNLFCIQCWSLSSVEMRMWGEGALKSLSLSHEHRHTHINTHTHTHTPVHTYTCARICNHMVKQIAADCYKSTQTGCDVQVQLYKSWISVPSAPVTRCCDHC